MEQGWDPQVKRYFRKIILSFSLGLLWLIGGVTAGLYFRLAYRSGQPVVMALYYILLVLSLLALLRFYYRLWRN